LLAKSHSASDVAAIILAGVVVSFGLPSSLISPFEALPLFYISSEYRDESQFSKDNGASIILLIVYIPKSAIELRT